MQALSFHGLTACEYYVRFDNLDLMHDDPGDGYGCGGVIVYEVYFVFLCWHSFFAITTLTSTAGSAGSHITLVPKSYPDYRFPELIVIECRNNGRRLYHLELAGFTLSDLIISDSWLKM